MAVVINEFEVVVEPPPRAESETASTPAASASHVAAPSPHDVELINRRLEDRAARVHAD